MSIHAAAELVAERIRRSEYVEVVAHNDADGIAGGAILAHAMARAGLRFRLRIRREIAASDLAGDHEYLLCDLGAGMENLPKETMVVDHHEARFTGDYHVNPRLAGIDGDRELSGAGAAYLVAGKLGDNRDLAGLALLGMIGDRQQLAGTNLAIFNDGAGNGIILPSRGILLPGRDLPERLLTAISPLIDGVSGDAAAVSALAGKSGGTGTMDIKPVLSLCVLSALRSHAAGCVEAIYGDTYALQREVIADAHSLAAVIDACGKTGHGDLGAAICLRHSGDLAAAWEMTRQHRLDVIAAFHSAATQEAPDRVYEVERSDVASDVADALSCRITAQAPLAVIAKDGGVCRVSARSPDGSAQDLGAALRSLAQACGGSGGGHRSRAGATIPCANIGAFRKGFSEATAA
ncbi:MAG TPA: DHHA1 domain-containing protein [Methanoregulaceae archaeon]|nr:DHHA1 domain-containing protein [Methanoregulaceae archaeon]HPD74451.1 DHHA1 domain-containing protein [Methanoregulaceae archaeon]HRY74759.1 DHHA1 domain-containing protein [Methanoregulaceae archaeon]